VPFFASEPDDLLNLRLRYGLIDLRLHG